MLAGALRRVHGPATNRGRAAAEMARCYAASYDYAEPSLGKWNRAGEAIKGFYVDAIVEGMMERLRSYGMIQTEEVAPLRLHFVNLIETKLIATGLISGKVYSTYSQLLIHSPEKSFDAQVKAVELEPANGDFRSRLILLHAQRGEVESARQQFQFVLDLLPEYRLESLRTVMRARGIDLDDGND